MGKIVAILWIGAILFAGFWFGYHQEGANQDITIEMEAKGPGLFSGKTYITNDSFARVDERGGKKITAVIVDVKEGTMTLIDHQAKEYATVDIEFIDKSECTTSGVFTPAANKNVERLPDAKMIAGYRCHAFRIKTPMATVVMWFSYELPVGRSKASLINKLGRIEIDPTKVAGALAKALMAAVEEGDEYAQYSGFEYFPIPLGVEAGTSGRVSRVEATKIIRGKIDRTDLEVPSDFKSVDPQRLIVRMARRLQG